MTPYSLATAQDIETELSRNPRICGIINQAFHVIFKLSQSLGVPPSVVTLYLYHRIRRGHHPIL